MFPEAYKPVAVQPTATSRSCRASITAACDINGLDGVPAFMPTAAEFNGDIGLISIVRYRVRVVARGQQIERCEVCSAAALRRNVAIPRDPGAHPGAAPRVRFRRCQNRIERLVSRDLEGVPD